MRHTHLIMTAVALAAGLCVAACADPSIATRPRTVNPYAGLKDDDSAARRAMEAPVRTVPTGGSGDAPRQLNEGPAVPTDRPVVLLQAGTGDAPAATTPGAGPTTLPDPATAPTTAAWSGVAVNKPAVEAPYQPTGWGIIGNYHGPTMQYNQDHYSGSIPHIPANPGANGGAPMVGSTPVAGTGWSIDHSWGEVLPLTNYPHRAWPETTAQYEAANIKHNPVYYFNIQEHLNVTQNNGTTGSDWMSQLYEVPWFYLNTAALPVLMVLEPPLAQRTSHLEPGDPNYHGYLPTGPVVPTPYPGELRWEYPFLNPDGSVIKPEGTTSPATRPGV